MSLPVGPCLLALVLLAASPVALSSERPLLRLYSRSQPDSREPSNNQEKSSRRSGASAAGGAGWPNSYTVANALGGADEANSFTLCGESFELYSDPIELRYGEVHYRFQPTTPLPPHIVRRFAGKHMALTGYEINVVRLNAAGKEESVPAYDAYNHHYSLTMMGSNKTDDTPAGVATDAAAVLQGRPDQQQQQQQHQHQHQHQPSSSAAAFPPGAGNEHGLDSHWISEGNGNEHRLSFHGYPEGHAQVIYSPDRIVNFLHLINTRGGGGRGGPGSAPLPRSSQAKPGARYSGLIECPCSTRRVIDPEAQTVDGRPVIPFGCQGDLVAQNNTSCSLKTYRGGLRCCEDGVVLLDRDQLQPPEVDTFRFKMRFFFEDAEGSSSSIIGSIGSSNLSVRNLFRLFWQTDLANGEYDVPQCDPSCQQCVHVLKTDFTVNDMCRMYGCGLSYSPDEGFELIYVSGHLHVGGVSLELWNADTGQLICAAEPVYGASDEPMDEEGYIVSIPPCLFSDDDPRLPSPPRLVGSHRLVSVAKYRSDPGHHGVMAFWQMRARY